MILPKIAKEQFLYIFMLKIEKMYNQRNLGYWKNSSIYDNLVFCFGLKEETKREL